MVYRCSDLPENEMEAASGAIVVTQAVAVEGVPALGSDFAVWKSPVNERPGLLAYWIGTVCGGTGQVVAYRMAELTGLPNGGRALEMKRAWVWPNWRGTGLSTVLMRAMARNEQASLITDRDGVTDSGYLVWEKSAGWRRSYWDQAKMEVVPVEAVPDEERFASTNMARRWVLILDLASRTDVHSPLAAIEPIAQDDELPSSGGQGKQSANR